MSMTKRSHKGWLPWFSTRRVSANNEAYICGSHTFTLLGQFPDPQKAAEDLHAFAKLNERRLYKLLTTCMDPQTDLKSLVKATVSTSDFNLP